MAAPELTVPLRQLLPIQAVGVSAPNLQVLAGLEYLPPVEAVIYENDMHLLVDGTHRAYLAYKEGRSDIQARVATTDEELMDFTSPALFGLFSIAAVHRRYQNIWVHATRARGVSSISRLPIHHRPR